MRIYWANAMFNDADRAFNSKCAKALKEKGFVVHLPQDAAVNHEVAPSDSEIFVTDTKDILSSDAVIACIDAESIDAGVAAEIGIAYAAGIPVIGICTDLRQRRTGPGQLYKNLYVTGLIKSQASLVANVDDAAAALNALPRRIREPKAHFSEKAGDYRKFIFRLEKWYEPKWDMLSNVVAMVGSLKGKQILDFGSGTGDLAVAMQELSEANLVAYDPSSEMIAHADKSAKVTFTNDWEAAKHCAPYDLVTAAFVTHDVGIENVFTQILEANPHKIVIIDLGKNDLASLIRLIGNHCAMVELGDDPRLSPTLLAARTKALGLELLNCHTSCPTITFPDAESLLEFLDVFGILQGMDWPSGVTRRLLQEPDLLSFLKSHLDFPYTSLREFHCFNLGVK